MEFAWNIEKNKMKFNSGLSDGLSIERLFSECLDTPSMFINGKRKYKRRKRRIVLFYN